MLHLSGYNLSMDDLKNFRQLDALTPGHPECFMTEGVEVTTGPLGQGISNAVGMAIAEEHMAAVYNRPGFNLFDHYTYVFCGDGCLQEGVASEAASIAGHQGLGKLIVMYDDNKITIDGETHLSFSEDVPKRFQSYGWHTITVERGDSNFDGILHAIELAKSVKDRPSLISVKTIIGFGSLLQGKEECHGAPLTAADISQLKSKFNFDPSSKFEVKSVVAERYARHKARGHQLVEEWTTMLAKYAQHYPAQAAELQRRLKGQLPLGWEKTLPRFTASQKGDATRNLSGNCLNALAPIMPELLGGSADLTPSNKTALKCTSDFAPGNRKGRYLRFGVREHGMAAIGNGLAAYGAIVPFTATFLNFIEYCFPAVRIAALSKHHQIFVMTHDSIGLGEDGPTHQPVECVALCRATPNLYTFRPADGNETSGAYMAAISLKASPHVLCLSRQGLPHLPNSSPEIVRKGAYVVTDAPKGSKPDLVLVATGSEVSLALQAAKSMSDLKVRVVSMPCTELFDEQSVVYRRSILTPGVPTVAIEALVTTGWEKYSHYCIGMTTFGASAPIEDLMERFGFTAPQVVAKTRKFLNTFQEESKSMGGSGQFPALPTHFSDAPILKSHL